jgi:hypothetical protein
MHLQNAPRTWKIIAFRFPKKNEVESYVSVKVSTRLTQLDYINSQNADSVLVVDSLSEVKATMN